MPEKSMVYYTSTDPDFGKISLKQFIETEVKERGNYTLADVQNWMRKYNLSGSDLAIWVSPMKWVANRYNLLAQEWDRAAFIPESEMNVYEIQGDQGFIILESDDGDEGYLFVFKNPILGVSEMKESVIDALLNVQPGKDIIIGYGDIPKGAEKITLPLGGTGTVIERRRDLVAIGIFAAAAVVVVLYVQKDSQMIRIRPIPHQKIQTKTGEIVNTAEYNQWLERIKKEAPEYLPEWEKTAIKGIETKQPWEMSYGEFAHFFEEVWSGQRFTFAERVGKPLGIQSQAGEPYHMIKGRRIGYSGSLSRDRWRLAIVDKALSEGKKVPDEVMAELSGALKEEKEKLGGNSMAQPQGEKPDEEIGSPYEVKATLAFIPRERVWSTVLEDSTGYCHGAQNYHLLKEALDALKTGELEQDFERYSAREFYITQLQLDPENPDDLKQIMEEYSEGHDPRRGIKIIDVLYTDEVKAQKAMLEHAYTTHELNALNIEDLKKIATAKDAKTTGKKEEVIAAILQSQEVEKPAEEKKLYRYYFLHRPPEIGTMPENPVRIERWLPMRKTPLGNDALGWAEYDRPLTTDEIRHFELFVDEPVMPKLVKELVQFAHDEGIDEAMKAISPEDEYYRAVMAWLKAVGRERMQVDPMVQIRDEVIRLAGTAEKEKPVEIQPAAKPKIEPKVTDTQAIRKRVKEVAEWWFNSQMKNPFTEFYLYHKAGDFRVATETPEGYKLSDAQRISPAWTKEQAEQWIFDKVQRLPILPLMPVAPLPLYSPRAEPTYKEIIRTQEVRGWTVKYKFEWKSAMGYYSGFIWVNQGIGEGIRTAIINITSLEEIPKEVEKAIAEAEKVSQKPVLESAELLYKRYTSGYSYVSLLGIVQQDLKGLAHSIGYELKLDTTIYTPEVLLQYAEKFKEYAQRDYDIEHKKHEARKEKELAEKEREKREGGEAFWNEVKGLKVMDFEVQHDENPDRPTRTYFHVYDRTIATLENGKRVQISYVINKGEYGKRALKATKEYYVQFYNQYMGKPLSEWINYDQLIRNNRYEDYQAQKPVRIEVLERFPSKSLLEPKIREYGKWIRENTYGEAGVRKLQTGSWEEVTGTLKELLRKYYNLAPAPADYIFRRPSYQQTEIGIDSLATTFFNVAANGWDLAETFREWEAGETRQEWERRLKQPEIPQPPAVKPEAPVTAKVLSTEEIKQQALHGIQQAKTAEELKLVLKGIGFLPLADADKRQLMDAYQNRFNMLQAEKPFGAPVKEEEKAKVIGAPSKQELAEAELRRKAEEGKKLRGQVELGGAVTTAARLGLFELGAMEKAKAEAEARKRIEQLGLPGTIHPLIKRLAESTQDVLKFGSKRGKETIDDLVLARYVRYCPAGTIVDNRNIAKVPERWWVYPVKLRGCLTEVQQKIAAAMMPAGVAMVKEAVSVLTPSMRQYIQGARAIRDVIHYFIDRRPPIRGVLYRARDGTYFVEAQDGGIYASMGWVDVDGWSVLEQASLRAGATCR